MRQEGRERREGEEEGSTTIRMNLGGGREEPNERLSIREFLSLQGEFGLQGEAPGVRG